MSNFKVQLIKVLFESAWFKPRLILEWLHLERIGFGFSQFHWHYVVFSIDYA